MSSSSPARRAELPASGAAPIEAPHARSVEDVVGALGSDARNGLSQTQVERARVRYGPNVIEEPAGEPWTARLLRQFRQGIVWILIVAAGVALLLGEQLDAIAILSIVALNAVLGFAQEERAARALDALRRMVTPTARVIRGGSQASTPSPMVVPGDLLLLEAGDQVPADARLVDAFGLRTQEAALTGESTPVEKDPRAVLDPRTPLADRRNMIYAGTAVAAGKAKAVVTATGMATEVGRIAGLLETTGRRETPLERRLDELSRILVVACLAIVAVIAAAYLLRGGEWLDVLLVAISLGVAAVPEGLPAVVTVALALGLQRMARRNALVRQLPSVETLGSVQAICTDKTGTLTRNEMTVRVVVVGPRRYSVSGTGYAPHGALTLEQGPRASPSTDQDLELTLTIGARCNNAEVAPMDDSADAWNVVGDPTEGALLVAAMKRGIPKRLPPGHHVVFEIPFESDRRLMTVAVRAPDGSATLYTKGAPEALLERCAAEHWEGSVRPLDPARRRGILATCEALTGGALRVLALAYRDAAGSGPPYEESDLVFAGLAGMQDPPREEARAAVATCRRAGIYTVMITGDHPVTALAVAREVTIAGPSDGAITGTELDELSDESLAERVDRTPVYARVTAEHKLRVVRAWNRRGYVVAMTGDGVNDAAALQAADVGVAMGRSGTDVARNASDLVLLDDNFASIVSAVEEGRTIFDNIQKFVQYLLATNAGEILLMFFAAMAGWPMPLLPVQILWINLVTDGLPALALGVEPPEPGVMERRPRPPHARVISAREGGLIAARGLLVAAVAAVGFALAHRGDPAHLAHARVVSFSVVAYAQLSLALAFRSQRFTLPQLGLFSNPALLGAIVAASLLQLAAVELPPAQALFEVQRPLGADWLLVAILALIPVTILETGKIVRAWLRSRRDQRVA